MLRKTMIALATTLTLSTGFAAAAMAHGGGGHGGGFGGAGHASVGLGGEEHIGAGLALPSSPVGGGSFHSVGGIDHTALGLTSLPTSPVVGGSLGGMGHIGTGLTIPRSDSVGDAAAHGASGASRVQNYGNLNAACGFGAANSHSVYPWCND